MSKQISAKQLLLDAAATVEANPKAWTKTVAARDSEGKPVPPCNPNAVCWCAIGFVVKANENCPDDSVAIEQEAIEALRKAILGETWKMYIPRYNDSLTPIEFVAWSRRAAALC